MMVPLASRFAYLKTNDCPEDAPRCPGYSEATKGVLRRLTSPRHADEPKPEIVIVHIAYLGVCGVPPFAKSVKYTIARAMFEQDSIPKAAAINCNKYDEVWVPSQFNVETFARAGVARSKLKVVGEPVDTAEFDPDEKRPGDLFVQGMLFNEFRIRKKDFVFLSIFKWEERKNWQALLSAFCLEFHNNPDTKLLIKTQPVGNVPNDDAIEFLQELLIKGKPANWMLNGPEARVIIYDKTVEASNLPGWYQRANAFVLPTRGEGWGLPIAEAMAMRLPTVATRWGGQTEFMNDANSFLVDVAALVPSGEGMLWAQIDIPKLRKTMRLIINKPELAAQKAEQAYTDMRTFWTQRAVSKDMSQRVVTIAKKVASTTVVHEDGKSYAEREVEIGVDEQIDAETDGHVISLKDGTTIFAEDIENLVLELMPFVEHAVAYGRPESPVVCVLELKTEVDAPERLSPETIRFAEDKGSNVKTLTAARTDKGLRLGTSDRTDRGCG